MNKPKRKGKKGSAASKGNYIVMCTLMYVCSLIFRIPLLYMIGEKGIAFYSVAGELYVIVGCMFTYGLSEAVSSLVRYRVKRDQFKNASRVLHEAILIALVTGIILNILFIFTGNVFVTKVMCLPLAGLAVGYIAPAILLQMLTGVFKGYFEGNGSRVPSMHSLCLKTLFLLIAGLIGASIEHKYGVKVSALLQNEDYAAAHGAKGAAIGILIASVLGFLHMLLLFFMYRGNTKKYKSRDMQKSPDSGFAIFHMLIGTAAPFAAYALLFRIVPLLDGIFFVRLSKEGIDAAKVWGNYYGKYLVIIGVISLLITLVWNGQIKKIIYYVDRDELRTARSKTGILVHQTAIITVPAAIFTAVLSENLLNLLFKGNNKDMAGLVTAGSVIIVLFAFSGLFAEILISMKKMSYVIGYEAIALIVHIILVIVLLNSTELSITAIVIGNIAFFAVLTVFGFLMVSRIIQYRQEWLHTAAFTLIAGAITGLITMLLNKGISSIAGTTISLVACLVIGIIIYMILLIVTRAVTEQELEEMPAGGILLQLGRLIKFM
ncbi:MAG: hypothetical protein HDR71_18845 [Lachnospiraceae bacterium]|nr:hypothetical protein [Lachnospiraceae bacterium]